MACSAASSSSETIVNEEGYDDCQLLNGDEIKILVESIEKKRKEVCYLQSDYNIYRVPEQLRKLKPEAYTPQSVSIGPLHCKNEHLHLMQEQKLRFLNRLLDRSSGRTLDVYVKAVSKLEKKARKCYSETIGFGPDEFVQMMVIDGCFILEFLEIITCGEKDHFLSNHSWYWAVLSDLIKLENQLPFFVLEHLHGLVFGGCENFLPLSHHIYGWLLFDFAIEPHGPSISRLEKLESLPLPEGGAKHFLDLLRCVHIPSSPMKRKHGDEKYMQSRTYFCASELKSAGVKFRKKERSSDSPKTSLFDIEFDKVKGVLTIPTIKIYELTEHVLRNLIAFEQGEKDRTDYFTAYAAFMDGLINTPKDVELLVQKEIIMNHLGRPEDVVALFNNLIKHVTINDPCFSDVIRDMEDYHNKPWNKRKASLIQNYFNSPWALISFLAAVFLLILTVVQAVCSILQVKP